MDGRLFERVPTKRLGDLVYESLVQAIAAGRLGEGHKLYEDDIAKQMGVSTTPVREALRHLAKDGFVEADLHRTPMVRRLSQSDVDEIYKVREYLEPLAVRLATERAGGAPLGELLGMQHDMEALLAGGGRIDVARSVEYNQAFHRALVVASGNQRLRAIMEPLWVQILRLSFLSQRLPGKQARAITEHRAILDAVRRGEADRGEALIREHVRVAHQDLVRSLPIHGTSSDADGDRAVAADAKGAAT